MNIINLTPYAINFVDRHGNPILTVEPSGKVARVMSGTGRIGSIDGIPVTTTVYGVLTDLPEPEENTIFLVSSLVAQRVPERDDVFVPNESVRDEKGRIIGCRSLGKI